MRDLSRLTIEEKNRYLILKSSLIGMLGMSLDDIIDSSYDQEILDEIAYLEKLADGKISRDSGKVKRLEPSKNSHE